MPVAILDADPQASSLQWMRRCEAAGDKPALITVEAAVGEIALSEKLDGAGEYGVVIVDLPGVLNQVVGVGASRADLVIVPMRMSFHDVTEAVKLLKWLEAVVGHTGPVNARIVANDVDAIAQRTAAFREAARFAVQHNLPFFNTVLRSRNVFKAMAHQSGSLSTVPADPDQLEKAKRNIGDLMSEILRMFPGQDRAAAEVDAEGQRADA
jgi:chromosome partitioning protein